MFGADLRLAPGELRVWASHGDLVAAAPPGFSRHRDERERAGRRDGRSLERRLYALLFHPEVAHTEHGLEILRNFAYDVLRLHGRLDDARRSSKRRPAASAPRLATADEWCAALSGGVDSTVAALLVHRAIGDRLTCIFVDNGLLRLNEAQQVRERFTKKMRLPLDCVDARDLFVERLAGVIDPERKRKIIGADVHRGVREPARASSAASTSLHRARSTRT